MSQNTHMVKLFGILHPKYETSRSKQFSHFRLNLFINLEHARLFLHPAMSLTEVPAIDNLYEAAVPWVPHPPSIPGLSPPSSKVRR